MTNFYGQFLTREQCWEEYEVMNEWDSQYEYWESGASDRHVGALMDPLLAYQYYEWFKYHPDAVLEGIMDRDRGYELMLQEQARKAQRDFEYKYPFSPEELEDHFNHHHIEPVGTPYWEYCVLKIDKALGE